ncbi:transcriptional regulator [candidate division KSB1 bacterium]|nr:transcriptional regulator [candidate division KSB1 bacterium]MBL7095105.1 transcriptional regulator [candidate division KSB1 bacterium]
MKDFNYQQLDDIIHSRIRLTIMSILVGVKSAEFTYIKDKVKATDGNLSIHLRKLESADYISMSKSFVNRKPVTTYKITNKGRKAFKLYISRLEKIING